MAMKVTAVSSTAKIYVSGEPRPLTTPVILFSGDVCHLQLAIAGDVRTEEGVLRFSGGAAARAIKVNRVGFVPGIYDRLGADDYYELRDDHIYPDVLETVDIHHLNTTPGYNLPLFLTIRDSEKIPVGDNTVTVTYLAENGIRAKTSFVIRKLAARLPEQKSMYTSWMHYDGIFVHHNVRPFSRDFYKVFGSYLDAAVYSGQTMLLTPIFTPAFDTRVGGERLTAQLLDIREDAEGNFSFDFAKLREFVRFALAHGIRQLEMPPLFTQWGAKHAPKIMVKGPNGRLRRRFGWDTDALSEDYRRFLTTLLPQLVAELRDMGMEENTYFHVSDEPNVAHVEHYRACKGLVMPLLGDKCRTLDACGDIEFAGKTPREYVVPVIYRLRPFIEAGVRPLCTYYCCNPRGDHYPNRLLSMPLSRTVVIGTVFWRHDIALFLHWGFNFYNSIQSRRPISPFNMTDGDWHFPAGDPFIVYPDYAGRGALLSLRLIATRESFRLARILYLLEEKIGRDAVMEILTAEGVRDLNVYPTEPAWMDEFIVRLADRLA
ncbi:MAG: DUF4091 domain-containing protein [Clostridia bacterium]|nr:DUF4091 domain-containing protein [Clostridia bacterium]